MPEAAMPPPANTTAANTTAADTTAADTARIITRLWAAPTPPRRGPRPTLTLERIIDAAFDLADAEGLDAVTMARLGKALNVTPMALYRHVSNKDELLTIMADRVVEPPEIPEGVTWREGLEQWMQLQIDVMVNRPWFLDLPLSTLTPGPLRLLWIDQAFGLMKDLPLTAGEKLAMIGLLAQHVLGEARVQIEYRRAAVDPYADLAVVLTEHADPATYPHLLGGLLGEAGDEPDDGESEEAAFGVHILLDGVDAYVARRARERAQAGRSQDAPATP